MRLRNRLTAPRQPPSPGVGHRRRAVDRRRTRARIRGGGHHLSLEDAEPRGTVRDALQPRHEFRRRRSAAVALAGWPLGRVRLEPGRAVGRLRRAGHGRRPGPADQRPECGGPAPMVAGRHEAAVFASERGRPTGHLAHTGISRYGTPAHRERVHSPAWSADGRRIAYSSANVIWICDADGANPRQVTKPEPPPMLHYQPGLSHSGKSIAFVRRRLGPRSELALADVDTGAVPCPDGRRRARPVTGVVAG